MFTSNLLSVDETFRLLTVRRLPGRLTASESAAVLGFAEHDIPVLVAKGLLKPLGKPASNATKYFASPHITQIANDPAMLDRATAVMGKHWREKNQRKPNPTS